MSISEKSLNRLKDLIANRCENADEMNKLLKDILHETRASSLDKLTEAQFHFVVKRFFSQATYTKAIERHIIYAIQQLKANIS